jgi:hypothetical protein
VNWGIAMRSISVAAEDGSCIIAKHYRLRETGGIPGSRSHSADRSPVDYDAFWNGDRWVHEHEMAMTFETREQAVQYLGKNESQM